MIIKIAVFNMINFQTFPSVKIFAKVTLTTGLSRALHCAAANGSCAGAGLHGMGVALSAGVQ